MTQVIEIDQGKKLHEVSQVAAGGLKLHRSFTTVITPEQNSLRADLVEMLAHRELIANFVWRDLTTRYRQTVLGAGWAVLQPLGMMLVMTFVFGKLMHAHTDSTPYPVFSFTGLLAWQYFSTSVSRTASSVLGVGGLIKRVYFPRLSIPIASVIPPLVDFAVAFLMLLVLAWFFRIAPTWRLLAVPGFVALAVGNALGLGLWTSALHVRFRDIHHLVPFVLQIWFFLSPVAYSASTVPAAFRPLYALNPMVGVIEGLRWCMFGTASNIMHDALISLAICSISILSGLYVFRRMEGSFADYV